MRFTLALANLYPRFEGRIFSGDEVEHGKPSPDLFLGLEHEGSGVRAALWIAASRASESLSVDRLFDDPWAAALAGPLVVFEVDRGKSADLFQRNGWASAEIREPGQIGEPNFGRIRSLPKQWAGAEISNLRTYLVRGNNPP